MTKEDLEKAAEIAKGVALKVGLSNQHGDYNKELVNLFMLSLLEVVCPRPQFDFGGLNGYPQAIPALGELEDVH